MPPATLTGGGTRTHCRVPRHRRGLQTREGRHVESPKYTQNVNFRPWVGEHYCNGAPWGFRAMVLGEAHYGAESETRKVNADFTTTVVKDYMQGQAQRTRVFTKTARLFLMAEDKENRRADLAECRNFWQDVVFYNFIQDYVPDARNRPTPQMWNDAGNASAFVEVVRMHRPDLILVLGQELSGHLPTAAPKCKINHPSCFGWRYEPWIPDLTKAICEAKNARNHRH